MYESQNHKFGAVVLLAATYSVGTIIPAFAQSNDPEVRDVVVVTANKREQSLLDVTASVGVVLEEELRFRGSNDSGDILRSVVGVTLGDYGGSNESIFIRGVSSAPDGFQGGEATAIYLGDIQINSTLGYISTPNFAPVDIERVEVLRGPQGTLFGAGALAGVVRYVPRRPNLTDFEYGASASLRDTRRAGDVLGYDVNGYFSAPLANDRLGLRVAAYVDKEPGVVNNVRFNEFGSNETVGVRSGLLYSFGEDGQAYLSHSFNRFTDDASRSDAFDLPDFQADTGRDRREVDAHLVEFSWRLPLWSGELIGATGYLAETDGIVADGFDGFNISLTTGELYTFVVDTNFDAITQELRYESIDEEGFDYVLGLFFQNEKIRSRTSFIDAATGVPVVADLGFDVVPTPYDSETSNDTLSQYAGFFNFSYHLSPEWAIDVGGRLASYEVSFMNATLNGSEVLFTDAPPQGPAKETAFSPQATLSYSPNSSALYYIKVGKGFSTGGFTGVSLACGVAESIQDSFDSSRLWSYEAGAKFSSSQAQVSFAGYYQQYNDFGGFLGLNCPGGTEFFINTAGDARIWGFEGEINANLTDNLDLAGSVGYNNTSVRALARGFESGAIVGEPLPLSPRWQVNASLNYEAPLSDRLSFLFNINASYKSEYTNALSGDFSDFADFVFIEGAEPIGVRPNGFPLYSDPRSGGYVLVGAVAALKYENWRLDLYVDNLFDDDTRTLINTFGDTRGVGGVYRVLPRTVGVRISIDR